MWKNVKMTANEYQKLAARTLLNEPDFQITDQQVMVSWNALGLVGEASEVAEIVKKGIYHQRGIDQESLKKELGDILWYLSALCTSFDWSLEEIMTLNIDKLKERFPDGYDPGRTSKK